LLVAERTEQDGSITSKNVIAIHGGVAGQLPIEIIDVPERNPRTGYAVISFNWYRRS
jgi:hypothetical protein